MKTWISYLNQSRWLRWPNMFMAVAISASLLTTNLYGQSPEQVNAKQTTDSISAVANINLTGIKCIVDGAKNANSKHQVKYRQGYVYFSSQMAADTFRFMITSPEAKRISDSPAIKLQPSIEENIKRWKLRANHQLVVSGQYIQNRCPITSKAIEADASIRLGGVDIAFHDQATLKLILDQPQLRQRAPLVFGEKPFASSFVPNNHSPAVLAKKPAQTLQK